MLSPYVITSDTRRFELHLAKGLLAVHRNKPQTRYDRVAVISTRKVIFYFAFTKASFVNR